MISVKSGFQAVLVALLVSVSSAWMAFGQAVFGNITGTVTDQSGAAVPGATVAIADTDRGTTYTTTTNADGNYTQTHLLAGH
jgi:protocatechuate 3,4-dioxygenase beta subunit